MPSSAAERRAGKVKPPARWPKNIPYVQSYQFHESVTPPILDFIKGNPSIAGQLSNTYRACVAIRPISDTSHPACGQYGLFAITNVRPHTRILDYLGRSLAPQCVLIRRVTRRVL